MGTILSVLTFFSRALLKLVGIVTYRIPKFGFDLLSWTGVVTLEFNFAKIILLLGLFGVATSYFIKFKYLNRYTQLKEVPLVKDEGFDLHPNIATEESQRLGLNNYLDEFRKLTFSLSLPSLDLPELMLFCRCTVSAIKIFGYLEKPVFHELARHLQTKRLIAGDSLSLDSDHSFYIVIDGTVQVFVPTHSEPKSAEFYNDDETEGSGLQLLNEVQSGGTLSSLFTILSLFTEQINIKYEEETPKMQSRPFSSSRDVPEFDLDTSAVDDEESAPLPPSSSPSRGHRRSSDSDMVVDTPGKRVPRSMPQRHKRPRFAPDMSEDRPEEDYTRPRSSSSLHRKRTEIFSLLGMKPKDQIIARAKTDTTLAVIPAHAFKMLTKKFPNSAAHIVQVILTRLTRVTLLTCHNYLGLTKELIRTEKAINELACYPLPAEFYQSGGMHRLRQRFVPDTEISVPLPSRHEDEYDYFDMDLPTPVGPSLGRRNTMRTTTPGEGVRLKYKPKTPSLGPSASRPDLNSILGLTNLSASPVDSAHAHLPFDRSGHKQSRSISKTLSFIDHHDLDLRTTVMECIAKAMGLFQHNVSYSSQAGSVEQSPNLNPLDANMPTARPFPSSFASLSYLGTQRRKGDGDDDDSVTASSALHDSTAVELENEVEILFFARGTTLVKEGQDKVGVFYVIDGFLDVSMPEPSGHDSGAERAPPTAPHKEHQIPLFTVQTGGIAGYLSSLTGASYVNITAKTDVYIGYLPAAALERMMDRKPVVLLTLAKRLLSLLSPLIFHIDLALEWMQVTSGQVIYSEGDHADAFYICIQGRLRAICEKKDGGVEIKGEYGQGESVGELDCITSSTRPTTLHAIRDSELVRMPAQLFNAIATRQPSITVQMTRLIAAKVRAEVQSQSKPGAEARGAAGNLNLKTVAILPITHTVPVTDFALRLKTALEGIGAPTSYLNQATVINVMGRHAFSRFGKLKLAGWLANTEQKYRTVLYVADSTVSSVWTQTCIRQADCILLVAIGAGSPSLGEYERLLVSMKTTARKELVLLHPERAVAAGSTRQFLRRRPWLHAHHHVQMTGVPEATFLSAFKDPAPVVALKNIREKVMVNIGKYRDLIGRPRTTMAHHQTNSEPQIEQDYARLARWLCGKSIGVVLGGGGARGISHVGALRALTERGIPVDMVGGTSIGSFIGGLYAREADLLTTHGRAKKFSGRMSTLWRLATDLTYPVVAYTTGHEFNRGIFKSFYDLHIEDFWLPFFAVTTNITWSRMEVHTTGYAWRFIRASMSLAGLLPPLCSDGDMLLDGGYFDNLPVSSMLARGAASVFAIDVGSIDDTSPRNFGDSVSGWWVVFCQWWPWSEARNVPSLTEIQSRLTYVSSVKTLEEAKSTPGVFYMRQPVTMFGTMDFGKHNEIDKVGYKYAKECLDQWEKKGSLPTGRLDSSGQKSEQPGESKTGSRMRRASI